MGDLINLNRVRKRRDKSDASKKADLNRAKFGRTKSERESEVARAASAAEKLEQHKLSDEDGT